MTTILSMPTTVTVNPPPPAGSVLGPLATSMAPGTWAQLTVSNQNALLGVGSSTGSILHYCNAVPWNPVSRCIEIIARDAQYPNMRHVRYDDASSQFMLVADNTGIAGIGHGYDHNVVNPFTGDLYHRRYSVNSGAIQTSRKTLGAPSFASIPTVASPTETATIGVCWWSGSFVGGGSQGSLVMFNAGNSVTSANDGQIVAFNPLTNAWFYNQTGKAPFFGSGATYNTVLEYSPSKNVAVYGGGNVAPNRLWRLNSDGSFIAMPNTPAGKTVGMQRGQFINDPVTGNFLLLSAGELWELDPGGTGTWTQQTGSRTPPAGVGIPNPPTLDGLICCSIPDYGVVAFIKQTSSVGGRFYLYKHA